MSKTLITNENGFIMACPDNEELRNYDNYEKFDLVGFGMAMQWNVRVPLNNFNGKSVKPFAVAAPFKQTAKSKIVDGYQDIGMHLVDILVSYIKDLKLENDLVIKPLMDEFMNALTFIKVEAKGAFLFPKATSIKYNPLDKGNKEYSKYAVKCASFNQETNDRVKMYAQAYFTHLEIGKKLVQEVSARMPKNFKYYTLSFLPHGGKKREEITMQAIERSLFLETKYPSHTKKIKFWHDKFKLNPNYLISLKSNPLQNEAENSLKSIMNLERWKDLGDIYLSIQISEANHNVGFIKKIEDSDKNNKAGKSGAATKGGATTNLAEKVASIHFDKNTALKASKAIMNNYHNLCAVAHYRDGVLIEIIGDKVIGKKIRGEEQINTLNVIIEKIKIENTLQSVRPNEAHKKTDKKTKIYKV